MFRRLTILLALVCSVASAYDVTSNAFQIDISKNIIILSDNVQIQTSEYNFVADKAVMGLYNNNLRIDNQFKIKYMDQIINGEKMLLDNQNKVLTADHVELYFYKYMLFGEDVLAKQNQVKMNDVMITSCRGDNRIFYLKSEKVSIYPSFGFLVAFNSILYLYDVPILYFPAYFMGDRRYSSFANNSLIPEIGSNKIEGSYIKENIPYYLDAKNNGTLQIAYLSNYGIKAGFQHYSVLFDGQHKSSFGLYSMSKLWQSNFKYTVALFKEEVDDSYFLSFLFNNEDFAKRVSNVYLSYIYKENEIINNQFVNIKPGWELSTLLNLDDSNELNADVSYADIQEHNLTRNARISYLIDLKSNFKFGNLGITNAIAYFKHIYSNYQHFESLQDNISMTFPVGMVQFLVDYEHIFNFSGGSPFNYDMYQIDSYDKIGASMKFKFNVFALEYKIRKRLTENYYYYRQYEVSIPFEQCMDFIVYWEDIEKEFGVSIRI